MDVLIVVALLALVATTVFFAYRYFSLKQQTKLNKDVINGLKELAAGQDVQKVAGQSEQHQVFNALVDHVSAVKKELTNFGSSPKSVLDASSVPADAFRGHGLN